MSDAEEVRIIAFYEFKDMSTIGDLATVRDAIKDLFRDLGVRGTIILADEGYNGMVCGSDDAIDTFICQFGDLLKTNIIAKSSYHDAAPFRRIDVKIKPEIVTLKKEVDMNLAEGTHVQPRDWNDLISDPETFVLDTRNDYEFKSGTFHRAVNPETEKFSDLPKFVEQNLDPDKHKRVAMFCTGGIRCEKFAPYLKQIGFKQVFQLEGGILKYLEEVPAENSLWEGECFVFDERITVDHSLSKGSGPDHSQRVSSRKDPRYKVIE